MCHGVLNSLACLLSFVFQPITNRERGHVNFGPDPKRLPKRIIITTIKAWFGQFLRIL